MPRYFLWNLNLLNTNIWHINITLPRVQSLSLYNAINKFSKQRYRVDDYVNKNNIGIIATWYKIQRCIITTGDLHVGSTSYVDDCSYLFVINLFSMFNVLYSAKIIHTLVQKCPQRIYYYD